MDLGTMHLEPVSWTSHDRMARNGGRVSIGRRACTGPGQRVKSERYHCTITCPIWLLPEIGPEDISADSLFGR